MPTESFNFRIWFMVAMVAMLSATAGVYFWKLTQQSQQPTYAVMTKLPVPRVIDDFTLEDQNGQQFSLEQLRGSWSLLFFGFTHCPDVCPSSLYELQKVKDQIQQQVDDDTEVPQIIFVSVDPERDSPQKMSQYLTHFDPEFIGITGTHEQLLPFTRQIGIAYIIEDHEAGAEHYSVDHSSGIMLMNPAGELHGVFTAPHRSDLMANDLVMVLESSS